MSEGISVCGSGVGAFVMAPLVRWLVNTYDWEVSEDKLMLRIKRLIVTFYQTAVLVLSGICLCCVLFGGLIRPLEEVVVPDTRQDGRNVICSGVPLKCTPQMSLLCTSNQPS